MITSLSLKITSFLENNMRIEPDMVDIYRYGIEVTLSSLLNIILVVIAGVLTNDILASITFLCVFILLRSFTGGYHATTYMRCNTIMVLTFLSVKAISIFLFHQSLCIKLILLFVFLLPVIVLAPVKNIHKVLSEQKRKSNRIFAIVTYITFAIISVVVIYNKLIYGSIIIATLISVSVMILIEIFMQRRGYHES